MYAKSASPLKSFLPSPRILLNTISLQEAFSHSIKLNSITLMVPIFCSLRFVLKPAKTKTSPADTNLY